MQCPRCEGLMIRDHFYDPEGPLMHVETLRCLNCGETVYPKTPGPLPQQSDEMPDRHTRKRTPQAA